MSSQISNCPSKFFFSGLYIQYNELLLGAATRAGRSSKLLKFTGFLRLIRSEANSSGDFVYWRAEGSLLELTAVRPIAFFTWNAQTFTERWVRRGLVLAMAAMRPFLYAANRAFATRAVYAVLRGISRDRLDLLGEEYFTYKLKPHLKPEGVRRLKDLVGSGAQVVLVSQGLDHVMRPLAQHLGVSLILANRMEFRDGIATGRLLDPVIRPRGVFARISSTGPDGKLSLDKLARDLGVKDSTQLRNSVAPAARVVQRLERPLVDFESNRQTSSLSVRAALRGRHILLIGVTGFIGKVWLANTLSDVPDIGRIYLLVRRQKSNPAQKRFEKLLEESPVFDPLYQRHGQKFLQFIKDRVQVIEGDVTQAGLGLSGADSELLCGKLDLVVNSSGLTDFNPDLRGALSTNVDAAMHILEFVRSSDHAGLLHLSTCYVAGARDGRVAEAVRPDCAPVGVPDFDAEAEWQRLHRLVEDAERRAEGPEVTEFLRQQAVAKEHAAKDLHGPALENQIRKNRVRWLRTELTDAGARRANELGWPNTYTLTKSLAESLLTKFGTGLPIAIVRPAIVESSTAQPFRGWNEGINTSAALSYLLGTYFRQLPTNERKRLDIVPVDAVCRGMTLIAAAIIERRHDHVYQLATSVTNPCDMRRSIELTSLAHRKHYRAQEGMEYWLRLRFDAIPVSKERYNRMSAPAQRAMIKKIQTIAAPLPLKKTPLAKADRNLEKVEKLIQLFEPFILRNEHDFIAENVEWLSAALVPDERRQFGYDASSLDWYDYWINVHIPALRKWTYPLIEGRPLEARPPRNLQPTDNDEAGTIKTGTTGVTWRFS
jgi:thioester reductase-like protein